MPCGLLAIRAALLEINPALVSQVFTNPLALQAIRDHLTQTTGYDVSVWNDKTGTSWHVGYSAWCSRNLHPVDTFQVVPLAEVAAASAGSEYMDFCSEYGTFRITLDGRIEGRDGWRLGNLYKNSQDLMDASATVFNTVAIAVMQNMIAQALAQAGVAITANQVDPQLNARILTIEL